MKKLPIGIQEFSKLREGDFIYIDKTDSLLNDMKFALRENNAEKFISKTKCTVR